MEYKFIELLSLEFNASVEHTVRQQITYRYNANKVRPPVSRGTVLPLAPSCTALTRLAILPHARRAQSRLSLLQARLAEEPDAADGHRYSEVRNALVISFYGKRAPPLRPRAPDRPSIAPRPRRPKTPRHGRAIAIAIANARVVVVVVLLFS